MKKILIYISIILVIGLLIVMTLNFYVTSSTKEKIISKEEALKVKEIDCILVLGAKVQDGKPRPLLEDRIKTAIELYKIGAAKKIIMSGDHGKKDYDEVNVMKDYAVKEGIPSEDIFMDHAGFSTYDSIYRAKEIFKAKNIIIVTQEYHLYRALYIANELGLNAYGVKANPQKYSDALYREAREVLARNKDFVKCIFKPKSTYLGEEIPISGNGNSTNDK